jgi:hypothetical protein
LIWSLVAVYAIHRYPLTENFSKPLLDVQGKIVFDWLLSDNVRNGMLNPEARRKVWEMMEREND